MLRNLFLFFFCGILFIGCSSDDSTENYIFRFDKESIEAGKVELRRNPSFSVKLEKREGPKVTINSLKFIGDVNNEFSISGLSVGDVLQEGGSTGIGFNIQITPKNIGEKNVVLELTTNSNRTLTLDIKAQVVPASLVDIPDLEFKKYLLSLKALNKDGDEEIQVVEAEQNRFDLFIESTIFSNLKGIESFKRLNQFFCANNELIESIDLRGCESLKTVEVWYNDNLTSLFLPNNFTDGLILKGNKNLKSLSFEEYKDIKSIVLYETFLDQIDLKSNKNLETLGITKNHKITDIDLSNNDKLSSLWIKQNNDLLKINIANSNNGILTNANFTNNPNLKCIQIDADFTVPSDGSWVKDSEVSYSTTTCE